MPQIAKSLRQPLRDLLASAKEKGEVCYLFTANYIIPTWSKNAGWTTASTIRRMLVQEPDRTQLRNWARGCPFDDVELLNQAAMAYDEFYRRVVANYEDTKAKLNSDVYAGVPYAKSNALTKGE